MMKDIPTVVTGERIDPLTWSFADHFASISKLLDLSGNPSAVEAISFGWGRSILDIDNNA
jgi:hypothetical protein